MNPPRVALAVRTPAEEQALRSWVESHGGSVVASSATPDDAVAAAQRERPDLILARTELVRGNAQDLAERLWAQAPETGVAIVGPLADGYEAALRAGAVAYIEQLDERGWVAAVDGAQTVARRRALRAQPQGTSHGQVVGVVSAKGGVGRSFVAANLAASLGALGESVLLDLDLGYADLTHWGRTERDAQSIDDLIAVLRAGEAREDDVRAVERRCPGFVLLPGSRGGSASNAWLGEGGELLRRLAQAAAQRYSWVVLDTGPSLLERAPRLIQAIGQAVVVSGPELGSLRATRRFLSELDGYAGQRIVAVNRANRGEAWDVIRASAPQGSSPPARIKDDRGFARRLALSGLEATAQRPRGVHRTFLALASELAARRRA